MVQRLPEGTYRFDPADPRAPTQAQWDRMTPEERDRVVDMLPSEFSIDALPPEGDPHWKATASVRTTLDDFFLRAGRKVYISANIGVYYPGESIFAPDILAVLDVEPGDRTSWVVAKEGKGLDLVIEIRYAGRKAKDYVENVERYARLGIQEYFIFDRAKLTLRGYRLPPASAKKRQAYQPIVPQAGRFASAVLGLDLMLEGSKLRFMIEGTAPLLDANELIAKLGSALDGAIARVEEAERRAEAEAERAEIETERAEIETERAATEAQRATTLAQRVVELEAEIERLKRDR